jgi:hypothetical protein
VCIVPENLVLYRIVRNDKHRLTNNFQGWEEAVKYIDNKHEYLISQLTPEQKKEKLLFYYNDAISRCNSSGLHKKQKEFLLRKFEVTHNIKDFIKYIFNVEHIRKRQ